jgi:hypothetical protein
MQYAQQPFLRIKPAFLLAALIILALLPIWSVRYFAPHDYYHHLLEAQVVAHYHDPAFAYQAEYQIRDGWYLRSNALSTLVMIGLGQMMPIEIAGKIALSLYVVLLAAGVFWLLAFLNQPSWLLLLLPVLTYNVTFTWGWMNWSYGVVLNLLALLCYLRWRERGSRWLLPLLAGLTLLIYLAHGFAWGMSLIILCALAVIEQLPLRRYLLLCLTLSSAVPVLLIARPALAAAPVVVAAAIWLSAALIRRQQFRPITLLLLAAAIDICYVGGVTIFYTARFTRGARDAIIPYIGYLFRQQLLAPIRLLTLPHYEAPVQWALVGANLMLLALLACIGGCLIYGSIVHYRTHGIADWRWLALFGLLVFCYPIMPSYTPDISGIAPRFLLLTCVIGLCWMRFPPPNSRAYRILIGLLVTVSIFSSVATLCYVQRYDTIAQSWAHTLAEMRPASRVLVLGHSTLPIPHGGWYDLARVSQLINQSSFVNTYAIEHGGFVTNTFWNGPLLSRDPAVLQSSWFDKNDPSTSVADQCAFIHSTYTYVVAWDITDPDLLQALQDCYGRPLRQEAPIIIWQS